jgi:hypothetical protein
MKPFVSFFSGIYFLAFHGILTDVHGENATRAVQGVVGLHLVGLE